MPKVPVEAPTGKKGGLDRMQYATGDQAFHRGHLLTIGLDGEHGAGLHGRPVDQNGTRAAMGRIASNVGPGQSELFPEEVHEEQPRLDIGAALLAVDGNGDRLAHAHPPPLARS